MLAMEDGAIITRRAGKIITIARANEADYYRALLLIGIKETIAAALTRGLITLPRTR